MSDAETSEEVQPSRRQSKSSAYRDQFAWTIPHVGASSMLAATWVEKPSDDGDEAIVLGVYYFRTPGAGRQKVQVWRTSRKTGKVGTTFIGSAATHQAAYAEHYRPLRLKVREARRAAAAAMSEAGRRQVSRAATMAARVAAGAPAKNDKRDLAALTGLSVV